MLDGRLASASADRSIRLWDVATGRETTRIEGQEHWINALCQLPDGRLTSGCDDSEIRLWDMATGREVARLDGGGPGVNALCLLPDGRLASASADRSVRLWDVATGRETARLEVDASVWSLVAISANQLVAGDRLGRLHWLEIVD